MDEINDWTTAEYLANMSSEELGTAMHAVGLHGDVFADSDGDVCVIFASVEDAQAFMTLNFSADPDVPQPGSLYDRATSGCVTLAHLPDSATAEEMAEATSTSWVWHLHPHLIGRRMTWHCRVYMSSGDANEITATLNTLRLGGAL